MQTLLLDNKTWDLVLDDYGNIAVASDPYSMLQDAASAIRLFLGELIYSTAAGVPYWTDILGKNPSIELLRSKLETAAKTVPGVAGAKVYFNSITLRNVTGQVQITDAAGKLQTAAF